MTFAVVKGLISRAVAASAVTAALAVGMGAAAQAKFVVLPSTLPSDPPQVEISAACDAQEKSRVLAALSDLRSFASEPATGSGSRETKAPSGIVMRTVSRGREQYIVFHAERSSDAVSNKMLGSCLTIFAGSPAMVESLGLYVPDNTVPLGWFTYSRRIGIYADPRAVNLFPAKRV